MRMISQWAFAFVLFAIQTHNAQAATGLHHVVPKMSVLPPVPHQSAIQIHGRLNARKHKAVDLPEAPLYIITPCARPFYLQKVRTTLDDARDWVWIIVYESKPEGFVFPDHPRIFEVWRGAGVLPKTADGQSVVQAFGSPQRNVGLNMVTNPNGYIYFLDDDNGIHPEFWTTIYPMLLSGQHDFVTFDQERSPGHILRGHAAIVNRIDTAMYVTRRSLIGDTKWTLVYNADGFFAEAMVAKAAKHVYVGCAASFYNLFTQSFGPPRTCVHPLRLAPVQTNMSESHNG